MSTNVTVAGTTRSLVVEVGQLLEAGIGHGHDADVGVDGGERVVGGQDVVVGQRVEERRLADVRQADDADREATARIRYRQQPGGGRQRPRSASGRAPRWPMTSPAQRPPSRVHSTGPSPWVSP